jgi:hypothetical protein
VNLADPKWREAIRIENLVDRLRAEAVEHGRNLERKEQLATKSRLDASVKSAARIVAAQTDLNIAIRPHLRKEKAA